MASQPDDDATMHGYTPGKDSVKLGFWAAVVQRNGQTIASCSGESELDVTTQCKKMLSDLREQGIHPVTVHIIDPQNRIVSSFEGESEKAQPTNRPLN